MKNNNLLTIVGALILGIVVGYIFNSDNRIKNQEAGVISSDIKSDEYLVVGDSSTDLQNKETNSLGFKEYPVEIEIFSSDDVKDPISVDFLRTDNDDDVHTQNPIPNPPLAPKCSDGLDNDADGLVDYVSNTPTVADPGCSSATDDTEENIPPVPYVPSWHSITKVFQYDPLDYNQPATTLAYNLCVLPKATANCVGSDSELSVILIGGGVSGRYGQHAQPHSGGAGANGSGSGGYVSVKWMVPQGITSIFGNVGYAIYPSNLNSLGFNQYVSGTPTTLGMFDPMTGNSVPVLSANAGYSGSTSGGTVISYFNPSTFFNYFYSATINGGSGGMSSSCTGGTGGSGTPGFLYNGLVYGASGYGGHGGYRNSFPFCTAAGTNHNLTAGGGGKNGIAVFSWSAFY